MAQYSPKLVCFACKFGWGYLNGNGKFKDLHNLVPVICCGKVDAVQIMDAFRSGADGVLVLGCPDGECHFQNGNYQARKRILLLKKTIAKFGIEPERLQFELALDPEGNRIRSSIDRMGAEIRHLGPLEPSV